MYDKRYIKEEISRNCESENLGIRGMILRKRVKSQEKAEMPASQKTKQWSPCTIIQAPSSLGVAAVTPWNLQLSMSYGSESAKISSCLPCLCTLITLIKSLLIKIIWIASL